MVVTLATQASVSGILLAIFESLRLECNKRQLFMKVGTNDLQNIFYRLLVDWQYLEDRYKFSHLKDLIVFSDSGPIPFSPVLQQAIQQLQLAGMICWPDPQEPDLMRLNSDATDYYRTVLLRHTPERLAYQDVIPAEEIAKTIAKLWSDLIVDRSHLMNLPD